MVPYIFFGAKYTGIKKYSAFVATVVITTAFTSFLSNILPDKFLLCTAGFIILLILYCRFFLHGTLLCHILFPVIAETTLMLVAISINALLVNFLPLSPSEAIVDRSVLRVVILIISKAILFGLFGLILLFTRKIKPNCIATNGLHSVPFLPLHCSVVYAFMKMNSAAKTR